MEIGNLDCVRFIYKNWGGTFSGRALKMASGNGALGCLKYARKVMGTHEIASHYVVFIEAVRNGHMDCVRNLERNGFSVRPDAQQPDPVEMAASSGHLEILKYLHSRGFSMRAAAIAAADAGHFECLVYAIKKGAHLRGEGLNAATHLHTIAERLARANQTKLLPLVLSHEGTASESIAIHLAQAGNLECLKLCIERGAPPSIPVMAAAAEEGHLACLQYLEQSSTNGCQRAPMGMCPVLD
eukprot:gene8998-10621_t